MNDADIFPLIESASASGSTGCQGCRYHAECGGLTEQNSFWGCFTNCETLCCQEECDWTCPKRSNVFVNRWREVGGWPPRPAGMLETLPTEELPPYIPVIQHGRRREAPLEWPVVALPTFRAVRRLRNGQYGLQAGTAAELRKEFQLKPETRILLISVAFDKPLETYWRYRRAYAIPQRIAALDTLGITTPNYSFFSDAPRPHTIWNRARMMRVTEELSQAGVGVIPHLNALTPADWDYWERLLKSQPRLRYIAKEFQTGLACKDVGLAHLDALRRLQDRVGRDLHLIAVGAARFAPVIAKSFAHFTIVDSEPFMASMYRRTLIERGSRRPKSQKKPTLPGAPLDDALAHNLSVYNSWIEQATFQAPSARKTMQASDAVLPARRLNEQPKARAQRAFLY